APLQQGQGPGLSLYDLGEVGGESTVTLLTTEIPAHAHVASCLNGAGTSATPGANVWASARVGRQNENRYSATGGTQMSSQAVAGTGGSLPHNNMPPYLAVNFCIALQGIYPARS